MERVWYNEHGRHTHHYKEMTLAKRPQDKGRDGRALSIKTLEHHGVDLCPEALQVTDAQGQSCTYACEQHFIDMTHNRCQDLGMDGSGLVFETLEHGGEYPDDMPQAIRVTGPDGQGGKASCICRPIKVDGKVVDSKWFRLEARGTYDEPHSAKKNAA